MKCALIRNASMSTIVAQFANSHGSEGKQTRQNPFAHYFDEFLYVDSLRLPVYLDIRDNSKQISFTLPAR